MEQTAEPRSRKATGTDDTDQNLLKPESKPEISDEKREAEASKNLLAEVGDYRITNLAAGTDDQSARLASLGFPEFSLFEGARRSPVEVGAPPESNGGDRGVNIRGRQVSFRTENGQSTFSDERGQEWTSKDGKLWTRSGSEGRDNWHGSISQTPDGSIVRQDTSYGVTTAYGADGSLRRSFRTREGKEVSITERADGSRQHSNGDQVWESRDGKNWTNGDQQRTGAISIDKYGRLHTRDAADRWQMTDKSAETQDISERITRLQKQYNVRFGYPGEQAIHGDPGEETKVELRMPTKQELDVIDEALQKYSHLAKRRPDGTYDFGGLKFGFVSAQGNGSKVSEHGWYDPDKKEIYFGPKDSANTRGYDGMEGTAIHEIAHHLQNLNWPKQRNGEDVPADVRRFFGFHSVKPGQEYRLTDKDGKVWQLDTIRRPGQKQPEDAWLPVVNGRVVRDPRCARSNQEMRDSLPPDRRTASDYFDLPHEAHAEAQAMLLMQPERLMNTNPVLYQKIKEWDQKDINKAYGTQTGANGEQEPKMIRDTNGHIIANTPEARARIATQEQHWRDNPRPDLDRPRTNAPRCSCCVRRRSAA